MDFFKSRFYSQGGRYLNSNGPLVLRSQCVVAPEAADVIIGGEMQAHILNLLAGAELEAVQPEDIA